jgi:hypothetical protein
MVTNPTICATVFTLFRATLAPPVLSVGWFDTGWFDKGIDEFSLARRSDSMGIGGMNKPSL